MIQCVLAFTVAYEQLMHVALQQMPKRAYMHVPDLDDKIATELPQSDICALGISNVLYWRLLFSSEGVGEASCLNLSLTGPSDPA
jgi:hypothetical protein